MEKNKSFRNRCRTSWKYSCKNYFPQNPNVELIGIRDIDRIKSQKISKEYNCKDYDSLEETLIESEAVIIAVPTSIHHEIAMEAIYAGKTLSNRKSL